MKLKEDTVKQAVPLLQRAAQNATGWVSTLAGVLLALVGVYMALQLEQQELGGTLALAGLAAVFGRDPDKAKPAETVAEINGNGTGA